MYDFYLVVVEVYTGLYKSGRKELELDIIVIFCILKMKRTNKVKKSNRKKKKNKKKRYTQKGNKR